MSTTDQDHLVSNVVQALLTVPSQVIRLRQAKLFALANSTLGMPCYSQVQTFYSLLRQVPGLRKVLMLRSVKLRDKVPKGKILDYSNQLSLYLFIYLLKPLLLTVEAAPTTYTMDLVTIYTKYISARGLPFISNLRIF
jgi:hypothetical protein